MTAVAQPADQRSRSPQWRGALVAVVVLVIEVVWARSVVDVERQVAIHLPWWEHHQRSVQWSILSVPFVLLAIGVSLVARSRARLLLSLLACVSGVVVVIGSYELIVYLFTHRTPTRGGIRALDLVSLMLVVTSASFAWCAARRRGTRWLLPALVVGCVSAGLLRWADSQSTWPVVVHGSWDTVVRTVLEEAVPVVLACLAAWRVEEGTSRPTPDDISPRA